MFEIIQLYIYTDSNPVKIWLIVSMEDIFLSFVFKKKEKKEEKKFIN